jgi:signal transduction histidine kinase
MAAVPSADGLARVVHDLHAPLTVIRGMCASLLRDEPARDRRRALALIDAEAVRLARGLRSLAHAGRPDATRSDLVAVAHAAVARFDPVARERGGRVLLRGRRAPLLVAIPPGDLERIVDNLIGNALRHGVAGGTVVVGLGLRAGRAELRVRDDGPGVPSEDRERIFRAGERGRGAVGPGRGLGLAIARDLAVAHGGRLTLDAVGEGACFRLALPAAGPADRAPRVA